MRQRSLGRGTWHRKWVADPENQKLVKAVLERVKADGASRPADFRTEKRAPGSWWNWDHSKIALEYLYDTGELAIANRINFQRIYDVRDRVIPSWVDRNEPTEHEGLAHLLETSMKAHGVCAPVQVGDYFHMKRTESKPIVESLIEDGVFVPIRAKLADRQEHDLLVHRDNLRLLERAADGDLKPQADHVPQPVRQPLLGEGTGRQPLEVRADPRVLQARAGPDLGLLLPADTRP